MHNHNNLKIRRIKQAIWAAGAVAFVALGVAGWWLIESASESAERIGTNVPVPRDLPVSDNLQPASMPASGLFTEMASSPNLGQDVLVQAGDFMMNEGFVARLKVRNQAQLTVSSLDVRLNLYADGGDKPVANGVIVPVKLSEPLLMDEERVISVPVQHETWLAVLEQPARAWRILAQVVSVHDVAQGAYPQNSESVWLSQVQAATEQVSVESAVQESLHDDNQNAPVLVKQNPVADDVEPAEDVVDSILREQNEMPTGEARVLSFEVRTGRQPAPDNDEKKNHK